MRKSLLVLTAAAALVACGAPGPEGGIAPAADLAEEQGTVRISVEISTPSPKGALQVEGTGAIDMEKKRGRLKMTTSLPPGTPALPGVGETTIIYDDKAAYLKSAAFAQMLPAGKSWVKIDYSAAAGVAGPMSGISRNDPAQALNYLRGTKDLEELGREEVRGVPTTHYSATIDFEQLREDLPADSEARRALETIGLKEAPMQAWIDGEGLPRRIRYELALPGTGSAPAQGPAAFLLEFFGYGKPVDVTIPPASEVIEQPMGA